MLVRDTPLAAGSSRGSRRLSEGIGPALISEMTTTERIYGARVLIDILFNRIAGRLTFCICEVARGYSRLVGHELIAVAALADVIKSKTAADRPKDRAVLPALRGVLEAWSASAGLEK